MAPRRAGDAGRAVSRRRALQLQGVQHLPACRAEPSQRRRCSGRSVEAQAAQDRIDGAGPPAAAARCRYAAGISSRSAICCRVAPSARSAATLRRTSGECSTNSAHASRLRVARSRRATTRAPTWPASRASMAGRSARRRSGGIAPLTAQRRPPRRLRTSGPSLKWWGRLGAASVGAWFRCWSCRCRIGRRWSGWLGLELSRIGGCGRRWRPATGWARTPWRGSGGRGVLARRCVQV